MGHNQLPDLGFDLLSLSLSLRQHQLNDPRNQVLRFCAAPKIRTYVWPRGWRGETGLLLEDHKGRACCTPKTHAPRRDSLGACDFAGTACTRQSLVFRYA